MDPYKPWEDSKFIEAVESLRKFGKSDPELNYGMMYIDKQARASNLDFYEAVFRIICDGLGIDEVYVYKSVIKDNARKWVEERSKN